MHGDNGVNSANTVNSANMVNSLYKSHPTTVHKSRWSIESIPSYCITLERRSDRWKRFQDQPGLNGLHVKRFVGVDGKTLDIKTERRVTTLTKKNIMTKTRRSHEELDSIGGVGCALSHIAVWQNMVDNNQDICLIFEDDAVVPPNFVQLANECIQQSAILQNTKAWDMWLLGGKWDDLSSIPGENGVIRVGAFLLFHAYVLTRRAAMQLLQDAYPIHAHIDAWVSIYAYMNDMRLVGAQHLILKQNERVKTDIQSDDECKLCNISPDFDKTQVIVSKNEWAIARGAEAVCVGVALYLVWRYMKK